LSISSISSSVAPPCGNSIFIKPEKVLLIPSRSRVDISVDKVHEAGIKRMKSIPKGKLALGAGGGALLCYLANKLISDRQE
jgi:hypothetical protein